jgi:hypothetical protein
MFRPTTFIPVAAATALLLLAVAAPAGAHYSNPGAKDCGFIVFTPQTDDGASSIMAKNLSCAKARRIVRAINRGNEKPFGFTCKSRSHDFQLAHADVRCKRGSRVVTYART